MNLDEIDKILKHTLGDYRVSRGEKKMLRQVLRELGVDAHELAVLRSRAFEIAEESVDSVDARRVLEWLEEINKVFLEAPRPEVRKDEIYFTPGDNGPARIAGLFNTVRRNVDICVFTITDDRISDAIVKAHARRVQIRVLSDDDKALDPGSDIGRFRNVGIDVRVDQSEHHMHHKFAVFDNVATLTGSYNWTRSAAEYNAENFLVCHDPDMAAQYSAEFERLWKISS